MTALLKQARCPPHIEVEGSRPFVFSATDGNCADDFWNVAFWAVNLPAPWARVCLWPHNAKFDHVRFCAVVVGQTDISGQSIYEWAL